MTPTVQDLPELSRKYSVTEESPDDANHRRWKERMILYCMILAVGVLAVLGFLLILYYGDQALKVEIGKEIIAGLLGFLLGKKGKD